MSRLMFWIMAPMLALYSGNAAYCHYVLFNPANRAYEEAKKKGDIYGMHDAWEAEFHAMMRGHNPIWWISE